MKFSNLKPNLLFILLFPTGLFAQGNIWSDPATKKIMEADCHNKVFVKTEVPPSLKISKEAFEDTLTSYLNAQHVALKKGSVVFKFIVTSKSDIIDLVGSSGNIRNEKIYKEAIIKFADVWLPAQQNSHIVCAYVKLAFNVNDNKLDTEIIPY